MKKRLLSLLLALSLLPLPALGAEESGFSDVSPDDWFAPYVEVCVEEGLLNGVGDGRFAPQGLLNNDEALVMAARVLLRANGETVFPKGPDVQGYLDWAGEQALRFPFGSAGSVQLQEQTETWSWDALFYLARETGPEPFTQGVDYAASRWTFFRALAIAVQGLDLPAINEISSVPGTRDERILDLYRAGILSGTDGCGSFSGQRHLTRAEAAAALARIADPSLRVKFTPEPSPYEGYTLTYLMDGSPNCGVTYPVCILDNSATQDLSGLLTLDGRLLPWPEGGVPSYGLEEMGLYVKIATYKDPTKKVDPYSTSPGMMDASGTWVVPPGTYDLIWPVEDGFYAWITEDWTQWQGYRLDLAGQVAEELGTIGTEPEPPGGWGGYNAPDLHSWNGLTVHSHGEAEGAYYVNSDGIAASQIFDWAGAIGPDGRGFVGMDEKIYRIQFEN